VCTIGCPVAAIHKGDRGNIVIESWCVGCELCANSCPYGAIAMHDRNAQEQPPPGSRVLKPLIANVCDQCQTQAGGTPSCVYACPHGAALRVDALEFMEKREKALAARARPGAKP
jgi:Fe-S-cluster-containing hydrogenase component 2